MATDNLVQPNHFTITMPKTPIIAKQVQSVDLGGLTLNETELPYSDLTINVPGEKLTYGKLDLMVLIDENLDAYVEAHNYMVATAGPNTIIEQRMEHYQDITLSIMSNSQGSVVRQFNFKDCWITFLGQLAFDYAGTEGMVLSVTISFTSFTITPNNADTTGFFNAPYETEIFNDPTFD